MSIFERNFIKSVHASPIMVDLVRNQYKVFVLDHWRPVCEARVEEKIGGSYQTFELQDFPVEDVLDRNPDLEKWLMWGPQIN